MLLVGGAAQADLETDRITGECAGLLTALNKSSKAANAIELADNQKRATHFGLAWIEKIKKHESRGNKSIINSMVSGAAGACRKIGIRSSD